MADFPALPLWTDAYIADTAHLTNEEHGVYLRLLMFAWRTPGCALPDDDRRLALMVGVTPKKWASMRPIVSTFWTIEGGTWTQKRLTAERKKVEGRSNAGRAGAEARWEANALKDNAAIDAKASPAQMPERCEQDASISISKGVEETSSSTPKEEEDSRAKPLVVRVMEAVGVDPASPPKYWRGPGVSENIGFWLALGLTPDEIVAVAKASRAEHPEPPDGPKALDRVMGACATQKRQTSATKKKRGSKPLAPPPPPPEPDKMLEADQRLAAAIKRGSSWCANTVSIQKARSLLAQGLVTEEELRACGVSW